MSALDTLPWKIRAHAWPWHYLDSACLPVFPNAVTKRCFIVNPYDKSARDWQSSTFLSEFGQSKERNKPKTDLVKPCVAFLCIRGTGIPENFFQSWRLWRWHTYILALCVPNTFQPAWASEESKSSTNLIFFVFLVQRTCTCDLCH